ncbi:restriction endonuclease subunit S [Mesorhizobium sp. M0050]|uniref:restriction endonuclease subunit S n=1 Tax=Mesorhizobium sp. M0050 TaxID=2956861 RepID=UPI0033371BCE
MTMAYPSYRPSKVEWLGSLPQHWGVRRIKETSYLKARVGWKGLTSDEFMYSGFAYLVTGTDFRAKFIDWSDCYCVDRDRYDDDPFIQLENGDLLITKDGTIGKLAIVIDLEKPACLNSGIFVVRPIKAYTTSYLYWVLSSPNFTHFCDLGSYGSTIQHLYQNVFENFSFPIPPIDEQTAIANFLDRETGKIDALVEEQKRLVELLKEKRQAVISHAVTKGLNPNVPMKASGVEWLGDVPQHWEVSPLKRVWSVTDCKHVTAEFVDDGVPLASIRECQAKFIDLSAAKQTTDEFYEVLIEGGRKPQSGDLIFTRNATVGAVSQVAEWHSNFAMGQDVCLLRKTSVEQSSDFLQYVLEATSTTQQLDVLMIGSTFKRVNVEEIRNLRVPFPSPTEQAEIVQYLDDKVGTFDDLIAEAERAVGLLRERRAALTSAAITGKIDVRNLASEKLVSASAPLETVLA